MNTRINKHNKTNTIKYVYLQKHNGHNFRNPAYLKRVRAMYRGLELRLGSELGSRIRQSNNMMKITTS